MSNNGDAISPSSMSTHARLKQQQQHIVKRVSHHSRPRPILHFTGPYHINDPCAPAYDKTTGLYHLFYQCNPAACEWGNTSWGHITSKDLLHWKRMPVQLQPSQIYDKDGVFTGCWSPDHDSEKLTVYYSSIAKLPFFWHKMPYPKDAAGLAMATSVDGGLTWQKHDQNPILSGEPDGVNVTGFRDPFTDEWAALDRLRGSSDYYGIISGGIDRQGPTVFLYTISKSDLSKWKYICPLVDIPARYQSSAKWSGNFGVNWECSNFMTLTSGSKSRHVLILGSEADVERRGIKSHNLPLTVPPRTVRYQMWMSGELELKGSEVRLVPNRDGILDHGSYYAANTFIEPQTGRRIVHGWIPEEDIPVKGASEKGWNGALALPREVFLTSIPNVTGTTASRLQDIPSLEVEQTNSGIYNIHTIGIKPIDEIFKFRQNCLQKHNITESILQQVVTSAQPQQLVQTQSIAWELEATVRVDPSCRAVGFHIKHSDDLAIRTTVVFYPQEETLSVQRQASTADPNLNKCDEQGPFTLFSLRLPDSEGSSDEDEFEKLYLRIISDGDTLEVFANDRFALATMIYTEDVVRDNGISAFVSGDCNRTEFEAVTVWDGLNACESCFSPMT